MFLVEGNKRTRIAGLVSRDAFVLRVLLVLQVLFVLQVQSDSVAPPPATWRPSPKLELDEWPLRARGVMQVGMMVVRMLVTIRFDHQLQRIIGQFLVIVLRPSLVNFDHTSQRGKSGGNECQIEMRRAKEGGGDRTADNTAVPRPDA